MAKTTATDRANQTAKYVSEGQKEALRNRVNKAEAKTPRPPSVGTAKKSYKNLTGEHY